MGVFVMKARQSFFCLLITAMSIAGCQTAAPTKKEKVNYLLQANNFARDGLWREAVDAYKKALAFEPDNSSAHRNLGIVYVKIGSYKDAAFHLEKSIDAYNNNFDSNFYLGEAYRGLENYAEAIFRYKRALKIKENNSKALKALAWSYFKIRYYSEALVTAKQLSQVSPKDEQSSIILARTLLKLKRGRDALTILRSAKSNANENTAPFFESVEGDILLELGDQEGSMNSYLAALKSQPLLPGALLGIGKAFMAKNDMGKAISYMERALRVKPNLTEAQYLLGKAYESVDKDKSARYYQLFAKQAATDPEFLNQVMEVREHLSSLNQMKSKGQTKNLQN
jgi:tetratricopeptide (TPR) repeat protein